MTKVLKINKYYYYRKSKIELYKNIKFFEYMKIKMFPFYATISHFGKSGVLIKLREKKDLQFDYSKY
jgi:hypothetical protein